MKSMSFIGLCAVFAGLFFSACQKDDLALQSSDVIRTREVSFTYTPNDTICLGDSVTITYDNGLSNNCGQSTIQIWGPEDTTWTPVLQNEEPVDGEVSYTFTPDLTGTYRFRAHWVRAGSPASCPGSPANVDWEEASPLIVEDCACDTLFTGEAISCGASREAIYTFVFPDSVEYVKIQGGLTNFTTEDAIVTVTGGSDVVITQTIPGMSSNRIIRVEFSADACEEVTIHLSWNSTNPDWDIITGTWSAEDADGVALAPEVPGLSCPD